MKRAWVLAVASTAVAQACLGAFPDLGAWGAPLGAADVLKGLRGVGLRVRPVGGSMDVQTFSEDDVRSYIEAMLSTASIPILGDPQRAVTPGKPLLDVAVRVLRSNQGTYAVCVSAQLREVVLLAHGRGGATVEAVTWEAPARLIDGGISESFAIRNSVEGAVGRFCRDYAAANPPARKKGQRGLPPAGRTGP